MARAKRTDRATARRRYRASQGDEPLLAEDLGDDGSTRSGAESPKPSGRERVRAASSPQPPPVRVGMVQAFSKAFRPLDARADLAALPSLLRDRSFAFPFLLIAGVGLIVALTSGKEVVSGTLSVYFLQPPPIGAVFLAGFLAPRASWLIGALLGIIGTAVFIGLLSLPAIASLRESVPGAVNLDSAIILNWFIISIVGGALFAAVAAWYKRFLFLANPARAQRPSNRPTNQQRKRGSEPRPALARRR